MECGLARTPRGLVFDLCSASSIDELQREIERRDATMLRIDEEPRLEEVRGCSRQRPRPGPNPYPAATRHTSVPSIEDKASPDVLTGCRADTVAPAKWDPASNTKTATSPVIGRRELDLADCGTVERDRYLTTVEPVEALDGVAVALDDVESASL